MLHVGASKRLVNKSYVIKLTKVNITITMMIQEKENEEERQKEKKEKTNTEKDREKERQKEKEKHLDQRHPAIFCGILAASSTEGSRRGPAEG